MKPAPTVRDTLLLCLLAALLLRQVSDPDIWFYLVVGQSVARDLAVPRHEFYVFPVLGEVAHFTAWGFGLLHHLAHKAAGFPGMALVNALLGAGGLWLAALATRQPRDPAWLPAALVALAVAYPAYELRVVYRPETTLFLALGAQIWLLERWLRDGGRRLLLPLPAIAWMLAQLHTTAIFLLGVYAAYALQAWLTLRPRPALVPLLGIGLAMALLPMANPNGAEQVLALLRAFDASSQALEGNVEYLPVASTAYLPHFTLLAAAAVVALALGPRRRAVDALLLLAFGWLAWRYARNLGLFALVLVPMLTHSLAALGQRMRALSASRAAGRGVCGAALATMLWFTWPSGGWGAGPRPGAFPQRGAELLRRALPEGRVMNFYALGGYLAWSLGPRWQVAMDGHFTQPNRALALHDAVLRADPGWDDVLASWGVAAIVTPATLPWSGSLVPLAARLVRDARWVLVADEGGGLSFLAREAAQAAGVAELPKDRVWAAAARGAEEVIAVHPGHAEAHLALATARQRLGDDRRALAALRAYLALRPDDRWAQAIADSLQARLEPPSGAERR